MGKIDTLRKYWRNPRDNPPGNYIGKMERTEFFYSIMNQFADKKWKIIELGCGIGRNLDYIYRKGYTNLVGIDINKKAIQLAREHYREMYNNSILLYTTVEHIIDHFYENEFKMSFTMAFLEHLPKESEWVFREIKRITDSLIVLIEDEKSESWRHFPRDYKKEFEDEHWKEILMIKRVPSLPKGFRCRVFKRNER